MLSTRNLVAAVTAAATLIVVPAASAATVAYVAFDQAPTGGYVNAYVPGGSGAAHLSLQRGGTEIASANGAYGSAYVNVAPQTGDVVHIERSGVVRDVTFDGRPSFDPAVVCAGSKTLSGLRTATATLQSSGSYNPNGDPYAVGNSQHGTSPQLSGANWSVSLERALTKGENVYASFYDDSSDVSISSSLVQAVGDCPAPPAPTTTTPVTTTKKPDVTKPVVSLALGTINSGPGALDRLVKSGQIVTTLDVSEPGTVTQLLVLDNGGTLPASAAVKKPAVKLGRGSKVVKVAGKVKVSVKLTKAGKRALRRVKRAKLVLVTTVADTAGNKTTTTKRFSATRG
jgi:hypothetical protein